ncbi:hypothetical protein [Ramlibacter humi]|uniref:Uncharacterized protein n=1 Tax=Ramlibacter humi TaxID=2530451 RepID=A0A4Z0C9Q5_9BURK|nr:hypothetical protein [Ramlibacter humi]TFZ07704.1 hypothetical protein EZ216_00630 [Ramlibacter humi]
MDIRLQLLESFEAVGSDGQRYTVRAYDRLVAVPGSVDGWEPSGQIEYRLADERPVEAGPDGALRVAGSNLLLSQVPEPARG